MDQKQCWIKIQSLRKRITESRDDEGPGIPPNLTAIGKRNEYRESVIRGKAPSNIDRGCVLSRAARDRRAHDGSWHTFRTGTRSWRRSLSRPGRDAERSPEEAVLGRRSRDETSFYIDVGPGTYIFSSSLWLPPWGIALSHVYIEPIRREISIASILTCFFEVIIDAFTCIVRLFILSLNERMFVNSRRTSSQSSVL